MAPTDIVPRRTPGEIMRDLRKLLAPPGTKTLSQAKLAERLGYNDEYLQSVESGRRPMQPHFVDEVDRLRDEARFPDAFDRLIEELRAAVTTYWAGVAQPPASSPGDEGVTARVALDESLADELSALAIMSEENLDGLRGTLDAFSAKTEGRLDGLGGKLDRTEGMLVVLGVKIDSTFAKTDEELGVLEAKIEAMSAKTGEVLESVGEKIEVTSAKTKEALGVLEEKVEAASVMGEEQHEQLAAKVDDAGTKLDRTEAEIQSTQVQVAQVEKKTTGKLNMIIRLLCANVGLGLAGLIALLMLHCQQISSVLRPESPSTINLGPGGREGRTVDEEAGSTRGPDLRVDGSLGSRKSGPPMPHKGLPGQKGAPCHGSQEEHYDACWLATDKSPPCPPDQFQEGAKCYVPIQANPDIPIGGPGQRTGPNGVETAAEARLPLGNGPRLATPKRESK